MNYAKEIQKNLDNNRKFNEGLDIDAISADSYVCDLVRQISSKKSNIISSSIGQDFTLNENSKVQFSLCYDNVSIGKE
jgi:hypothetical protein